MDTRARCHPLISIMNHRKLGNPTSRIHSQLNKTTLKTLQHDTFAPSNTLNPEWIHNGVTSQIPRALTGMLRQCFQATQSLSLDVLAMSVKTGEKHMRIACMPSNHGIDFALKLRVTVLFRVNVWVNISYPETLYSVWCFLLTLSLTHHTTSRQKTLGTLRFQTLHNMKL